MPKCVVNSETKVTYTKMALKWCKENIGINDRKRTELELVIRHTERKKDSYVIYGSYCFYKNRMVIYIPNCLNLYDVVGTVIHEYTHYLQSRTKYQMYEKLYYYSTNPFERQAKRNELKYTKVCLNEIKKSINILQ